jgi:hypothetical protein
MLGWIVRLLFILAAPIAALLVSRDALNFVWSRPSWRSS